MQALIRYFETNNTLPETIIVFRDGVSDSQMDTVAQYEGNQFVNTFQKLDDTTSSSDSGSDSSSVRKKFAKIIETGYNPQFAYIIVQKRISTRIMTPNHENPPPGTILDHTVTRYRFKDFFLVPQAVTQGTVTPTHMVVVHENGDCLDADTIQKLAYKLTHMYFNWPGTVRVPAPCQYAHKLVDLVGEHLHNQPSHQLSDKLYFL